MCVCVCVTQTPQYGVSGSDGVARGRPETGRGRGARRRRRARGSLPAASARRVSGGRAFGKSKASPRDEPPSLLKKGLREE